MAAALKNPNLETQAMQALSRPTVIAIDIGPDAAPLPRDGLVTLVDFQRGLPLVATARWPRPVVLRHPPAVLVALLTGEAASEKLARFLRWLRDMGVPTLPPVVSWRAGVEAEGLEQLANELTRLTARGIARQVDSAQQAVRLRNSNGELRYRFALAESALNRRGSLPFTLAFNNEPLAEQHYDVLNEASAGLAQVLPSASTGVAAIGLHFGVADAGAAQLDLRLVSLEDARLLEHWLVAGNDIKPGWNIFGLSRALVGQDRTLELHLGRNGGDDRLPPLSLGAGQPIPTFQVRDLATQQAALPRSLALQVWRGLPGTRLAASVEAHAPAHRRTPSGGFVERPVAAVALKSVEHANSDAVSFDFRPVWAPPGENAATCHPPPVGITLGCLPDASPAETIKVSASIAIGNEKAHDVDFGLVVADRPARALEILQGGSPIAVGEAFSGWTQISSRESKRVAAFCDGADKPRNIFIATRMSKPGDNSYAQARFKDFTIMVRG